MKKKCIAHSAAVILIILNLVAKLMPCKNLLKSLKELWRGCQELGHFVALVSGRPAHYDETTQLSERQKGRSLRWRLKNSINLFFEDVRVRTDQ